jgi:CubicO group peptidase (beta-lactamase class C family)
MDRRDIFRGTATWLLCSAGGPLLALDIFGGGSQAETQLQDSIQGYEGRDEHKDLKSVCLVKDKAVLLSEYFNGENAKDIHDIRSVTKSITALLVGIAIDRRLIRSTDDYIYRYLPWLSPDKHAIRLRDLLTMRSGLAANDANPQSPGNEARLDIADDWPAFINAIPMACPPGIHYSYNSVTAFLAGQMVEAAAGMELDAFAKAYLFKPLGIEETQWLHARNKYVTGHGNLKLRSADLILLGELVLNKGYHNGHALVSSSWVRACLTPREYVGDVDQFADYYGYFWYLKKYRLASGSTAIVHFASGNGGNKIYVIPEYNAVLAIQSSAYNQHYGQVRSEQILLLVLRILKERAQGLSRR